MPSGESAEPTGGRVTRSLRKRLTSIDSDASSRPGTPILNSLQAIPETNTPTKRVTRRASLSTPAAATPSKETTNTPGRRVTRRRSSINISDSEDNAIPVQPISKEPTVAVVKEEPESPKEQPKRVLRSASKSPNDTDSTMKSKRGRKKSIKQEEPAEVIVLDNTIDDEPQSATKKPRVSIKRESISDEITNPIEDKKSTASPTKKTRVSLQKQNTPQKSNANDENNSKLTKSAQKQKDVSETSSSLDNIQASQQSPIKSSQIYFTQPLAQSTQQSPTKKNCPEPLKTVLFTESDDENCEKTVYPKTPGLIKSKSYILDGSNNVDKDETFKSSKKDHSQSDAADSSDEEETAVLDTKTPHKLKLLSVESSTPIQQPKNSPQKTEKSVEIQLKTSSAKEYVFSDDDDDDDGGKEKITSFQKAFTPSVSGTNSPKIDCIVPETVIAKKTVEEVSNKSLSKTPQKTPKNKANQSQVLVSDTHVDDEATDKNKEESALAAPVTKSPYKPKPLSAQKKGTPKNTPTKVVVFSDDDDDERIEYSQKPSNTPILVSKKTPQAKRKSLVNTSANSPNNKSGLSKIQVSDMSEDDKKDETKKEEKQSIVQNTKSPLKPKQLVVESASIEQISSPQQKNKSAVIELKGDATKEFAFSDDDDDTEADKQTEKQKAINRSVAEVKKSLEVSIKSPKKSPMKTPKKSYKKKTPLSKALCEDTSSSEENDDDIKKDDNNKVKETPNQKTKSPPFKAIERIVENKPSPQKQKNNNSVDETQQKAENDDGVYENAQEIESFPKSWAPSVSGKSSESTKIDCIVSPKSLIEEKNRKNEEADSSKTKSQRKRIIVAPDSSDDEDVLLDEADEFNEDGDEEEEENREKSLYVDDEAMEVPEGEESSYSEDENALPEYGESIGSQDSEDDFDDGDDEQPDEDDASFIVSDTEPIEELLTSEEEEDLDEGCQDKKSYKRIVQASESSGDEEEENEKQETTNKDDTDICLLVDSSFDESLVRVKNKSLRDNSKTEKIETLQEARSPRKSLTNTNNTKNESLSKVQSTDLNKTVKDGDFDSEEEEEEELNKSKPKILEQIIIPPQTSEQQADDPPVSPEKELLAKSSKRRSISVNGNEADNEKDSIKESRKSISKNLEDVEPAETVPRKSFTKNENSPLKRTRKSSILVRQQDVSDEEEVVKTKELDVKASKKSLDRSKNESQIEENLNSSSRRKSRNISLCEELDKSAKSRKSSTNESRKSLVRTSTEETNDNEDEQNYLDKTAMLLDEDEESETEETLPAINQEKEADKSQRRKSINAPQNEIKENDSDNSAHSEEDNQQQKPTQRRKSIAPPVDSSSDLEEDEAEEDNASSDGTGDEMESSPNEPTEAQFSNDDADDDDDVDDGKPSNANQTIASFMGEASPQRNSSRRKSIVANESKLDETFQLDPKTTLSSSLHESLHRNVLKKSLNQSQKRRQTIDVPAKSRRDSSDSEDEENSSGGDEKAIEIKKTKKVLSEKGLSVSLNSIQIKKKKLKDRKEIRNSFTIGVSLRMNSSDGEEKEEESSSPKADGEPEARAIENGASSESEDAPIDENDESSESEGKLLNDSEEEVLEKVKNVQNIGPYKSRKSMSNAISTSVADGKPKKATKRTSLCLQEDAASESFIENLAEEKKKIKQQKRKSSSFCGVLRPAPEEDDDDFVEIPPEPRSEKKMKKSSESSDNNTEVNVSQVLSRCEEMLAAANEAKRQAKMLAKKVKVKKPKHMAKEEKAAAQESEEVTIPLVSKKEIKRKEKLKKEMEKALKHSAAILTKAAEPVLKTKQKNSPSKPEPKIAHSSKRLDADFLESLIQLSNPSKKKTKDIETTPPSDKENSKKKSFKQKYKIEDVHTKIESDIETLETACGTVRVEPSTPKKLRIQHGFRESPKTPAGFKVQDISSRSNRKSNQKSDNRKFKTASGAFIEEDLETTNKNTEKKRKRKLPFIEEPSYTLPKTQWTRSGVFVEEDLAYPRPLANSTATQFLVASLNSSKKNKSPSATALSAATLDKALSFKQKNVKDKKVKRESSREVLFAKQRKLANKKF